MEKHKKLIKYLWAIAVSGLVIAQVMVDNLEALWQILAPASSGTQY